MGKDRPSSKNKRKNKHDKVEARSRRTAGAAMPTRPERMLPPEPRPLLIPPAPEELARDGSCSRSMDDAQGLRGWMVFDAAGRMEEVFGYREHRLTVNDLLLLDHFESSRAQLDDPAFSGFAPGTRKREANAAPAGDAQLLHLKYSYGEPASDGTYSVFVFSQGEADAWLVLDATGGVVDGAHFPHGENAAEEGFLFARMLLRRHAAGDPRVGVGTPPAALAELDLDFDRDPFGDDVENEE